MVSHVTIDTQSRPPTMRDADWSSSSTSSPSRTRTVDRAPSQGLYAHPDGDSSPAPGGGLGVGGPSRASRVERSESVDSAERARGSLAGYLRWLRFSDLAAVAAALLTAHLTRIGLAANPGLEVPFYGTVSHGLVSLVLLGCWLISLQVHKAYDSRLVGYGVQEYRHVGVGSGYLFAMVAISSMALDLDFAREYVLIAFPLGTTLILTGRWLARTWLVRQRSQGRLCDRVLVVGDNEHAETLVAALRRTPSAGYNVLGACVDDASTDVVAGVPVVGTEADALARARELGVDVIAVSSSAGLGAKDLRRLGWALEGTDIDLVMAPRIVDVSSSRVLPRPVDGVPLIHIDTPDFGGAKFRLKHAFDVIASAALIIALTPVLLVVALAVKLSGPGPILFTHTRIGRHGAPFKMLKFRSMVDSADLQLKGLLAEQGTSDQPLFKVENDPRITPVGRFIRKYSLDELPQLFNVLGGTMSLVGPRPQVADEVALYDSAAARRLLVKPGVTGLWQVSGRSNLSWGDSIRLDLNYIENWSLRGDLGILLRTVKAVTTSDGAV